MNLEKHPLKVFRKNLWRDYRIIPRRNFREKREEEFSEKFLEITLELNPESNKKIQAGSSVASNPKKYTILKNLWRKILGNQLKIFKRVPGAISL